MGVTWKTRDWSLYVGVFLVSMAILMYEILLTRIFSVTMWYHHAFAAISIALFGLSAGANLVYLLPSHFTPGNTRRHLAFYSLVFAVTMVISFAIYLTIPYKDVPGATFREARALISTYVVSAIPLVVGGVVICLALTRYPERLGRVYAADLIGAACGCVAVWGILEATDGPSAVVFVAALGALGGFALLWGEPIPGMRISAGVLALALAAFACWNTALAREGEALLRIRWVKGKRELPPLYEKWNSFSRIQVGTKDVPQGDMILARIDPKRPVRQLPLQIDAGALTAMVNFEGDYSRLDFLETDVVNLAYHVRPPTDVLVVGAGGGRDILSALHFGAESVLGVELNGDILKTVHGRFGDYTSHLDRDPRVRFVNDEARSFITRQRDRFSLIQISLIDTWAATAAGAFVLSENSLYTLEAWREFLSKLKPNGILSCSRWHVPRAPWEMYRTVSLAAGALREIGIENPRAHLILASVQAPAVKYGVCCLLTSRSPYTAQEVAKVEEIDRDPGFEVILTPERATDRMVEQLADGISHAVLTADLPVDLSPPTDDSPFFFNMLKLSHMFHAADWWRGPVAFNMKAVNTLGTLLLTALALSLAFILVPIRVKRGSGADSAGWALSTFFASIGLAFMLVEISQMQRLVVFLGHPVYGLSVVLFSLLLSSGVGSYLTESFRLSRAGEVKLFIALLAALLLFGLATPALISHFRSATNPVRILVAVGLLSGIGVFMGMPLPLGMKWAQRRNPDLTPWLWGVNGATSVCASILAVAIAMTWGISTAFWTGCGFYALAFLCFARAGVGESPRQTA
ncbi:MAG: hypothetical protein GHCLOJNM_00343 [bacterium]|nr:hypothetical protein [bacterium]